MNILQAIHMPPPQVTHIQPKDTADIDMNKAARVYNGVAHSPTAFAAAKRQEPTPEPEAEAEVEADAAAEQRHNLFDIRHSHQCGPRRLALLSLLQTAPSRTENERASKPASQREGAREGGKGSCL